MLWSVHAFHDKIEKNKVKAHKHLLRLERTCRSVWQTGVRKMSFDVVEWEYGKMDFLETALWTSHWLTDAYIRVRFSKNFNFHIFGWLMEHVICVPIWDQWIRIIFWRSINTIYRQVCKMYLKTFYVLIFFTDILPIIWIMLLSALCFRIEIH